MLRKDGGSKKAKVRCKENTMDSFYGKFLYEQVILKDHFLVKLKEVIDWSNYTRKFITYYKGKGYLTFMALNLKRLVKLLTGIGFKGEALIYATSS